MDAPAGAARSQPRLARRPRRDVVARVVAAKVQRELERRERRERNRRALLAWRRSREAARERTTNGTPKPAPRQTPLCPITFRQRPRGHRPPRTKRSRCATGSRDDGDQPPPAQSAAAELVEKFENWRPGCVTACREPGWHTADCPVCSRRVRIIDVGDDAVVMCVAGCRQSVVLELLERLTRDVRGAA